jgi:murein hydrolase activator
MKKTHLFRMFGCCGIALSLWLPAHANVLQAKEQPEPWLVTAPSLPSSAEQAEVLRKEVIARGNTLRKQVQDTKKQISILERRILLRSRAYVRLVRAGLLPVAGGFEPFIKHAMKIESARRTLKRDLKLVEEARQQQIIVQHRLAKLEQFQASLEVHYQALTKAEDVIRESAERKQAFERAFRNSNGPSSHTAVYGPGISIREVPQSTAAGFASMKGRLPFPLPGRSEVRSTQRVSASGPGLEFSAPVGTAVLAVYPGRVAFVGKYGDYGNMVILDHGAGYFSLSGSLRSIVVRIGEEVTSGSKLGTTGSDASGSHLYFELRHHSETIDAREYFGVHE